MKQLEGYKKAFEAYYSGTKWSNYFRFLLRQKMEKIELKKLIDSVLAPLDFKIKSNAWRAESNGIIKLLKLYKSNYGNYYDIYYGFNIKAIDETINNEIQVFIVLGSMDESEKKYIVKLLDLESDITDEDRKDGIIKILNKYVISVFNRINTEDELKEALINKELNNILLPGVVMNYFGWKYE